MTHQILPHLVFCTPGQNQEVKQGTNPDIKDSDIIKVNKKNNRQANRHIYISSMNSGKERNRQHSHTKSQRTRHV